jgi:hypothetical protein
MGESVPRARGATHDVGIDPGLGVVTKRFRSWARNDPAREWGALCLLAGSASGLAPRPLNADLDGQPPAITMSWLPGRPLGGGMISSPQLHALAHALDRLWQPVSLGRLVAVPGQASNPARFTSQVREILAGRWDLGDDPVVRRAHAAAASWLGSEPAGLGSPADGGTVLGQGDPNLANFLWDGDQDVCDWSPRWWATQSRRSRGVSGGVFHDHEDFWPRKRGISLRDHVESITGSSDTGCGARRGGSAGVVQDAGAVRVGQAGVMTNWRR